MNKDIIHKAIETPDILQSGVEDLEKISEQYPYFSAIQLLLTKAYQQSNDHRYTDQLHQAAIYSTDRKHLYDWIKTKHEQEKTEVETISTSPIAEVAESVSTPLVIESEPEVIIPSEENVSALVSLLLGDEKALLKEEPDAIEAPHTLPVAKESIIQEEIAVEEIVETMKKAPISDTVEIEQIPESTSLVFVGEEEETATKETIEPATTISPIEQPAFNPIEKEILLEAMQSSIELEVSEQQADEEEQSATHTLKQPIFPSSQDNEEAPEAGSYAAWILNRSRQLQFSEEDDKDAISASFSAMSAEAQSTTEADDEVQKESTEHKDIESSHDTRLLSTTHKKDTHQELIDRFLQFEPKITQGKASEYSPGNLAKESLEEDFSFVTETMALLYAKQGRLDKARKAFRKLIEQYPEKSVYFAAQLKKIDKYKK